jgi:hypothetical protein
MSRENYAVSWAWKNPPPAETRHPHDVAESWEIIRNLLKRDPKTGRPPKKVGGLPE